MSAPAWVWLQLLSCAVAIGFAGYQLSRFGDAIARLSGLSGTWIGLTLLAVVTSLPELTTGITAVTLARAPNLAVGNALGSCVLNLTFLVVIDFLFRREAVWRRASAGHVLAGAFGVLLLGFTLVSLLISHLPGTNPAQLIAWTSGLSFGLATPLVLGLYLVAMRTVFRYERDAPRDKGTLTGTETKADNQLPTMARAVTGFALAAAVVVGAGISLPLIAVDLAGLMGWNRSFVGSLLVSAVTTLPELCVTVAALRLGALDMAIGNLLGSNLFNVAVIAIDDLFFEAGPLLAHVSLVHAVSAGSAIVMNGLAMVGLFFRPRSRVLRAVGWVSLGILATYLFNSYVLFLYGE